MLVLIYHIILYKYFDFGDINLFILADQISNTHYSRGKEHDHTQ